MSKFSHWTIAFLLGVLPLATMEVSAMTQIVDGIEWTYTISDGKATVGGGGPYSSPSPAVPKSTMGAITIPSTLGGYPVTRVGSEAFYVRSGLTSVTIPDGVLEIGRYAFYNCGGLTSVTIPESVTSIGGYAFYNCTNLTSVTIPDGMTMLGDEAFYNCRNLKSVSILGAVTNIGNKVFYDCDGLTSLLIGKGVTRIGNYMFTYCDALNSVVIPDSVISIGVSAFEYCPSLSSVAIPDSVQQIGSHAFGYCPSLAELPIGNGVTSIGERAYAFCSSLSSVTIPDSVTNIGDYAFSFCQGLRSVTIPESVKSIGDGAFYACRTLSIVNVADIASWCEVTFGSPEANPLYFAQHLFVNGAEVVNLDIPNNVTTIQDMSFYGCSGLSSATIPYGLTSIGQDAFACCNGLVSIYLPPSFHNRVSNIGLSKECIVRFYIPFEDIEIGDDIMWFDPGDSEWCEGMDDARSFIRSGAVSNCETSSVETVAFGPGTLSFDWRISANRGDYCRLYLDGAEQRSITRSPSWTMVTLEIPDGEHVVRWSYERGSASAAGDDAAFLDNVDWQPLSLNVALDEVRLQWSTFGDESWIPQLSITADGLNAAQSGSVIGDGISALETILSGPGAFSWSWLLDSSGNAGVDVILDGEWLPAYEPTGEWTEETLEITDSGEHTIRFEYWNAGTIDNIGDCAFLDKVSWTPTTSQTVVIGEVEVPTEWLSNEALTILSANGGNYESAANATAANGVNKVWECYVAGISPTNAAARFEARIDFVDGNPVVKWNPDLNEDGTKHERVYTVEGKENFADSWAPANSASRFFRVKVSMP